MKSNFKNQKNKESQKSLLTKTILIALDNTLKSNILSVIFLILEYLPLIYFSNDTRVQGPIDSYKDPQSKYQNIFAFILKYIIPEFLNSSNDLQNIFFYISISTIALAIICCLILIFMIYNESHLQIKVSSFISITIRFSSDYLYFFFKILNFHVPNILLLSIIKNIKTNEYLIPLISAILLLIFMIMSMIYSKIACNYLYFSECNLYPNFHSEESYKYIEKCIFIIIYSLQDDSKFSLNMCFYILIILLNLIYLKNASERFIYINNSYISPIKYFIRFFCFLQMFNMIFSQYYPYQNIYISSLIGIVFLIISGIITYHIKIKTFFYIKNFDYIKNHKRILDFYNYFSTENTKENSSFGNSLIGNKKKTNESYIELNSSLNFHNESKNSCLLISDLFNILYYISILTKEKKIDYFTKLINKNINYQIENPLYTYFNPTFENFINITKSKNKEKFISETKIKGINNEEIIESEENNISNSDSLNPEKEIEKRIEDVQKTFFLHMSPFININKGVIYKICNDIIQILFLENFIGSIINFQKPGTYDLCHFYSLNILYDTCLNVYQIKSNIKDSNTQLTENMLEFTKNHREFELSLNKMVEFKIEFLNLISNSQSIYLKFDIISKFSERFGLLKNQIDQIVKLNKEYDSNNYIYLPYEIKFYYSLILKDITINREIFISNEKIIEDFSEDIINKPFYISLKIDQIRSCWRIFSFSNTLPQILKMNYTDLSDSNINVLHPNFLKGKYHNLISRTAESSPNYSKVIFPLDSKKNIVSFLLESKILPSNDMNLYILCSLKKEIESLNTITFMVMEKENKIVAFTSNCLTYFGLNSELVNLIDFDFFDLFQLGEETKNISSNFDCEINLGKFFKNVSSRFDKIRKDTVAKEIFYNHFTNNKNLLQKSYYSRIILFKKTNFINFLNEKNSSESENLNYKIYKMSILNSEDLLIEDTNNNFDDSKDKLRNSRKFSNEGSSMMSIGNSMKTKFSKVKSTTKEINIAGLLKVIFIFNAIIIVLSLFQIVISFINKNSDQLYLEKFSSFHKILSNQLYSQLMLQKLCINNILIKFNLIENTEFNEYKLSESIISKKNITDFFNDEKIIYMNLIKIDNNETNKILANNILLNIEIGESTTLKEIKNITYSELGSNNNFIYYNLSLLRYIEKTNLLFSGLSGIDNFTNIEFVSLLIDKSYNITSANKISITLSNIIKNSDYGFHFHLNQTYTFLSLLQNNKKQTNYFTIIIFFITLLLIKLIFIGFLLFKTYYIFIKFKRNVSEIENLSQNIVTSDLQALTKLKQNLKHAYNKFDVEYLIKKCDSINTNKKKKNDKILTKNKEDENEDENQKDDDKSILKDEDKKANFQNNKNIKTTNRNLLFENDNLIMTPEQVKQKIKQVEEHQDQQLVFLDMSSLRIFDDFMFSISISLIINILYYITYLLVNLTFQQNQTLIENYTLYKSQTFNYGLEIISSNQIKLLNGFSSINSNDYPDLKFDINNKYYSSITFALSLYKDIINLGITNIKEFENFNITSNEDYIISSFKKQYDLENKINDKSLFDLYLFSLKFQKYDSFNSDIIMKYNKLGDLLNNYSQIYRNQENDFIKIIINKTEYNCNDKNNFLHDSFFILVTLLRNLKKNQIENLELKIQSNINILFYINIIFYIAVLAIDIITVLYLLMKKIKTNFNMIKNMNDMICSII